MKRTLLLVAIAGTAMPSAALAQIQWANAVSGNWNVAANWTPATVPNAAGHQAILGLAGAYTVTLSNLDPSIANLSITNADAILSIEPGRTLALLDASLSGQGILVNHGRIQLNPQGSSSNSILDIQDDGSVTGTGEIWLRTYQDNAQIISSNGSVLTNGAGHTIRGVGQIGIGLVNEGLIKADRSVSTAGNTLRLFGSPKSNTGGNTIAAADASFLTLDGFTLTQSAIGVTRAEPGGVIDLTNATIIGGILATEGTGLIRTTSGTSTLSGVTSNAELLLNPGDTIVVTGAGLTNNAVLHVNPGASPSDAVLRFDQTGELGGTGQVQLRTYLDNARIDTAPGVTMTNGVAHTIRGVGEIRAALVNEGVIWADIGVSLAGNTLDLTTSPKTNNNAIGARAGAFLRLYPGAIDQTGGGLLVADAGTIEYYDGAGVIGGDLYSVNGGLHRTMSGTLTLRAVHNQAPFVLSAGTSVAVTGPGLTNHGVIHVNPNQSPSDAVLSFEETGTLGGDGEVQLRTHTENARIQTGAGLTLTHGPAHTIRGVGQITARLVNEGEIWADSAVSTSGSNLNLDGDPKSNHAVIGSRADSFLRIGAVSIDQSGGGMLVAEAGTIEFYNGASISDGSLEAVAGLVRTMGGTTTLRSVTNNAPVVLAAGDTIVVLGAGLTNNGVIHVNPNSSPSDAVLSFEETGALGGNGEVQLRTHTENARIQTGTGVTLTHGPDHTIRGVGQITARLINEGEIWADSAVSTSGSNLNLNDELKSNHAVIGSRAGSALRLGAVAVEQSGGGMLVAEAGTIEFYNGTSITGGSLEAVAGSVQTLGGTTTLTDVTNNAPVGLNAGDVLAIAGAGLTNNGIISVNPQGSAFDALLLYPQSGALGGTGEIRLITHTENSRLEAGLGATITQQAGHTVSGIGQVIGPFVNHGRLAPGTSVGSLGMHGPVALETGAVLDLELAGPGTGNGDRLIGTGAYTLGGALRVSPTGGYVPAPLASWTIITGSSVAEKFDTLDTPTLTDPRWRWRVIYGTNNVTLHVICLPDCNADGQLNVNDFICFQTMFALGDAYADCDGNGLRNVNDYICFQTRFALGCS